MKAFYSNSTEQFLQDDTNSIIGTLTQASGKSGFYQQKHSQTKAWEKQIEILKQNLTNIKDSKILLEYPIPRRAKRIDAVLLTKNFIYVIEFKINSEKHLKPDIAQVEDYALDLRDFHKESQNKPIIPILVSTEAKEIDNKFEIIDDIANTQLLTKNFATRISQLESLGVSNGPDVQKWEDSDYSPTPTIIEAANHIYAHKDIQEISRCQAGSENLTETTNFVLDAIKDAQENKKKVICFISGVPGAGKTLAGLNIIHRKEDDIGVFLSGNGPLVKVLTESLARDNSRRTSETLKESRRRTSTFIQNVHVFLDEYFNDKSKVPKERIILFDEAQRAWNKEQSMKKFNRDYSEPEMMLEIMSRFDDWCFLICLIGGGQEINSGEAGLTEWGNIIRDKYSKWRVHVSPELLNGVHSTGNKKLFTKVPENIDIVTSEKLHLKVSIRSYKSERLSSFVANLLELKEEAKEDYSKFRDEYPLVITRNLEKAKKFLKDKARGTRRCGVLATSGNRRLRAEGFDVQTDLDVAKWFLEPKTDVRSSSFSELVATEFAVQGLELDWTCLCWGNDLRLEDGKWQYYAFKGSKWQRVRNEQKKEYILNKYRVLLTRAREGMVIYVPQGSVEDKTRDREQYDGIYEYLRRVGVEEI